MGGGDKDVAPEVDSSEFQTVTEGSELVNLTRGKKVMDYVGDLVRTKRENHVPNLFLGEI